MASALENPNVRVGVAAIICNRSGDILIGKRKGSHGSGTLALPGGHLEYGEETFTCAERETVEETGLAVKAVKLSAVTNTVFEKERKHYITLFVWCELQDEGAKPQLLEPEKCEGWYWTSWESLCETRSQSKNGDLLFLPLERLVDEVKGIEALRP